MLNVHTLAAKVAVSLVAAGSLAAVGTGVAAATAHGGPADSTTSITTTTSSAAHRSSSDARRLCERRMVILQGMTQTAHRLLASVSIYGGLASSARAEGKHELADFWLGVVRHRDADVRNRDIATVDRQALYTALDHAHGTC